MARKSSVARADWRRSSTRDFGTRLFENIFEAAVADPACEPLVDRGLQRGVLLRLDPVTLDQLRQIGVGVGVAPGGHLLVEPAGGGFGEGEGDGRHCGLLGRHSGERGGACRGFGQGGAGVRCRFGRDAWPGDEQGA